MRKITVSRSYLSALHEQVAFGELRFGARVVDEKRRRISSVIREVLAVYPAVGAFDEALGVFHYPVAGTPFILLYDFDHEELRVHLIVHRRADRSKVDIDSVDWR
jgi:hypothetical protein